MTTHQRCARLSCLLSMGLFITVPEILRLFPGFTKRNKCREAALRVAGNIRKPQLRARFGSICQMLIGAPTRMPGRRPNIARRYGTVSGCRRLDVALMFDALAETLNR